MNHEKRPPYWCQGCEKWYRVGAFGCTVAHAPGTCCHVGEIEVATPLTERPSQTYGDV